jgi:hypothetical protein
MMPCVETLRTYRDYAPSAWKVNPQKFVSRSGHLAYMIRFVLALRSDLSSSRVHSGTPPSQERSPACLLPPRRILDRLNHFPTQLRTNGVLLEVRYPQAILAVAARKVAAGSRSQDYVRDLENRSCPWGQGFTGPTLRPSTLFRERLPGTSAKCAN